MRTERRYLRDTHNPFHIPEWMFMYYYRLPPTLAMNFIAEIEEFIMDSPDLRRIPLHIQVLCVLSFLTSGSYQLRVGMEAFNQISQTMISAFVKKICKIIVTNLSPRYLRFPRTQREAALIQYDFFMKTSLPGIIGIVDGTHISIGRLPRSVEPEYVNRKGKHSVNVQIICDSKYRIINCNARYPGSCHDSHIFESSLAKIQMRELCHGHPVNWLLGDSGYGSKPYMVVPFRNPGNAQEVNFNKIHSKIRVQVENTIGKVKGTWRCISSENVLLYSHERVLYIINSCCVLHNIMIDNAVPMNDTDQDDEDEIVHPGDDRNNEDNGRQYLMRYIRENNIRPQ
ncbi:Harbinger transposase-derived nuclease [Sergentomyia squamirostris]